MRMGKWTKLPLIAAMAAGLLAGCSGNSGGTENGDTPQTASDKAEKKGHITSTIYDRGSVPNGMGTIEDNMWSAWINENGPANVKFTAVPRWESQSKLNVLFASGSAPDLIFEFGTGLRNTFFDQKQLMPLDDLIANHSVEYKALMEKFPQLKQAGTKTDGKLYEVGRINEVYPLLSFFIREDWLEKLNLEAPKTTEEMIAVAKAFTENDPDGNGVKDTYGIAGLQFGETPGIIRYMFNANWINVNENDEIELGLPNMKAAAEFKRQLYEAGVVDKDFLTDKDGAKTKQDFLNGKIGMIGWMTGDYTSFATKELDTLLHNVPGAKLKVIELPATPVGHHTVVWNNPVQMTAVVNARAKDPETVMKHIDFLTRIETGRMFKHGMEGVHYTKGANGCPEITDQEKYKNEVSWAGDYAMLYSRLEEGKCGYTETFFNESIPVQKEGLRLFKEARDVYMTDLVVGEGITHSEHMPQLPKEMQVKMSNLTKAIDDLFTQAIIGGSKYTVEQAMKDAEAKWQSGGGAEIEAWYKDWWSREKDNLLRWDDFYEIYKQQQEEFAKAQ
ncbi:ABC transporter substrate-binding protein [Paenibacillus sambharensis]|uniref:ABC transporter substrate-binding protein n=1 Tax=Paenibacillus sambharensis TaxID=1803190 RepID=A0A2W1LLD1_9BACL|nr:extracellular solute-binding protein [Paenibacillus sambharensis]PZD95762.1 ABC transporter substrate-binding protein [Paenibacillus sambharensis]